MCGVLKADRRGKGVTGREDRACRHGKRTFIDIMAGKRKWKKKGRKVEKEYLTWKRHSYKKKAGDNRREKEETLLPAVYVC